MVRVSAPMKLKPTNTIRRLRKTYHIKKFAMFSMDLKIFQWKCPLQSENGLALSRRNSRPDMLVKKYGRRTVMFSQDFALQIISPIDIINIMHILGSVYNW